jgi:hypothetical protein
MSPRTESLGVASWSNIIIHTSLDMQATSRYLSSYLATTGGPRWPGTLDSTSKPVTIAIRPSYNTVDLIESFTLQRLQKINGTSSVSTLLLSFLKYMTTT